MKATSLLLLMGRCLSYSILILETFSCSVHSAWVSIFDPPPMLVMVFLKRQRWWFWVVLLQRHSSPIPGLFVLISLCGGGSPEEKHVILEKDTPEKDDCVCCLKEQACRVGTTCLGLLRVCLLIPLNQMEMQQMLFVITGKLHSNMNEGSVYPNICR